MKATKKPVEIDYFELQKEDDTDNIAELKEWVESFGDDFYKKFTYIDEGSYGASLRVKTLEGTSYSVSDKDMIIRGVVGEYYPCKKTIFEETYDKITE